MALRGRSLRPAHSVLAQMDLELLPGGATRRPALEKEPLSQSLDHGSSVILTLSDSGDARDGTCR